MATVLDNAKCVQCGYPLAVRVAIPADVNGARSVAFVVAAVVMSHS